jgi:hypothetical protein
MEELAALYYSPETGLSSADKIYERVKKLGLKLSKREVTDFIRKQESSQVFVRRKVKAYYPLISYSPFSRIQIDLADVSQLAHWNRGVKFLLCAIDVQTRFAFIVPLKSKSETEVLMGFKGIIEEVMKIRGWPPVQIDHDLESSFLSRAFKSYCEENLIHQKLLAVADYKGTAMVDRLIRSFRELLNRYLVAYKTKSYLDVLDQLVDNYNTRINSGTGFTPQSAIDDPEFETRYWQLVEKKVRKAKGGADRGGWSEVKVGDKVRVLLRKKLFEKGTAQRWSGSTHTVEKFEDGVYHVSGRVGGYKAYELLGVGEVESVPVDEEQAQKVEEEGRKVVAEKRLTRGMRKEGVAVSEDKPRGVREKRPRDFGPVILQ